MKADVKHRSKNDVICEWCRSAPATTKLVVRPGKPAKAPGGKSVLAGRLEIEACQPCRDRHNPPPF